MMGVARSAAPEEREMAQDGERGPVGAGQDVVTDQGFGSVSPPAPEGAATVEGGSPGAQQGLGNLVSGVVKDLQGLLRGEVQLATTELKEEAATAAGGAATAAAGGVVGLLGAAFLLRGVADLLGHVMPRWLANTLVGATLLGAAGGLGLRGKEQLSQTNLAPKQAIQSLRESASWAKERIGGASGG